MFALALEPTMHIDYRMRSKVLEASNKMAEAATKKALHRRPHLIR